MPLPASLLKRESKRAPGSWYIDITLALLFALVVIATPVVATKTTDSTTACLSDSDCSAQEICRNDYCTKNIYNHGCLYERGLSTKKRVCNSDDPPDAVSRGICRDSELDYMEVRLLSNDWETAIFGTWILQIILSELLDVPTTTETAKWNAVNNFYDTQGRMDYGSPSQLEALRNGAEIGDCRLANKGKESYELCAHVVTEYWQGGQDAWKAAEAEIVEPPQGLGVLGQEGWFIPKFTAERDASLLSYIGMQGEENRRKMAERFLRPTSWQEYCQEVSDNNCETPDSVATRAPLGEDENTRYFVSDTYTGHFRATEKNDCDTWPLNCTGHIVDYPCGCASFVEQIAYHLDIALDGDGKEKGSGGYTYPQMTDIWYAANYTKSDVVMMWWSPDLLYQTFSRTEAEFHRVSLPPPTQECEESRVSEVDRCSLKQETRVGDAMGACDEDPKPLYKVIASSLYELVFAPDIPEAKYSPAYDAIKLFQISGTQLGELLTSALSDEDYRAGVCQWVVDNMDYARQSIPRTYPRTLQSEEQAKGLGIAAYVVSVLAALSCLATLGTVFHQRGRRVMVFAQVEFLYLILCGLLLVSLGAVISAIPLSDGSCVSIIWLIIMGYTLQLVPLIAKVGAINRLMNAAASMKRVVVRRKSLFGAVVGISGLVCLYLLVWTLLDPPMKANEYELSPGMTVGDETVVIVSPYCTSQNSAWMIASLAWNCILLVCATVLAFQTRSLRQDFNESRTLGLMIYSHFLFVVMRVIMFFFLPAVVNESNLMRCMSLLFATDTIATILIYFVPTFLTKDEQRRMSISTHSGVVMEGANWWNLFSRSQIEGSVIYDGRMRSVVKDSENVGEDDSKDISTVSHHTMTDSNKSDSGDDGLRRRKSCVNCGQDPDHKAVMDDELPVESVASMPSSIQMDCNAP